MYTALDSTLAYRRREEVAREVISGRPEGGSRAARRDRRRRWSSRLARMLRPPSGMDAGSARAGNA